MVNVQSTTTPPKLAAAGWGRLSGPFVILPRDSTAKPGVLATETPEVHEKLQKLIHKNY